MKRTLMLVDDDVRLTDLLKLSLERKGRYTVIVENSSTRAVQRALEIKPDLVILDMNMPEMSGVGFLKSISTPEGRPKCPVLVLTARGNMEAFFAAVDVDGFLGKPCDHEVLLAEVDRIIRLRHGSGAGGGAPRGAGQAAKRTILIGEDDRLVSERMAGVFEKAGYGVEVASRGPDLLEKTIARRPDVVLANLILTQMNGDAVANILKEMPGTKDIPVVLYDGNESSVDGARFALPKSGVTAFVKTDDLQLLLSTVNEVVRAHRAAEADGGDRR